MSEPKARVQAGPLDGGRLRLRVADGQVTFGTFVGTASAMAAEVCAAAGMDWLLVDLEHGAGGEEQVLAIVPVAGAYGVPVLARVEQAARPRIGRVLDLGAAGVMLPRLDSAAEAATALHHLRYPPEGDRGVATYNRACRFGLDPAALERARDEVLGIVQVESASAVGQVDEIAALAGADVLFVGPRDLSQDLGTPGDFASSAFTEALARVLAAARRHGKAAGLLVGDGAAAAARAEQGWRFIAISSDSMLLAGAVKSALGSARAGGAAGTRRVRT